MLFNQYKSSDTDMVDPKCAAERMRVDKFIGKHKMPKLAQMNLMIIPKKLQGIKLHDQFRNLTKIQKQVDDSLMIDLIMNKKLIN